MSSAENGCSKVKVCVLVADFSDVRKELKACEEPPRDPAAYDDSMAYAFETVVLRQATAAQQIAELAAARKYDVYLNLCEWHDTAADVAVVELLRKSNVTYTGADPTFHTLSREAMKDAAKKCCVRSPDYAFVFSTADCEALTAHLQLPLIVKHHFEHDSMGMTAASRVTSRDQLAQQVCRMIDEYGGALVEEFIDGPEYTVLVVSNPNGVDQEPIAFCPVECKFPQGETFKHFDLKFDLMSEGIIFEPVADMKIAQRLVDASKRVYVAANAVSYARCDFRLKTTTDELFFLEINGNPTVLQARSETPSSADMILEADPLGHEFFLEAILKSAIMKRKRRET